MLNTLGLTQKLVIRKGYILGVELLHRLRQTLEGAT